MYDNIPYYQWKSVLYIKPTFKCNVGFRPRKDSFHILDENNLADSGFAATEAKTGSVGMKLSPYTRLFLSRGKSLITIYKLFLRCNTCGAA
jgi:hypothetical protein